MARYDDDDDDIDIRKGSREHVPNYLVQAILTVCCCWPLAIVAIVYAAQVNGLVAQGKYAEAVKASENAKMWAWIAFGVGIFTNIVGFIVQVTMQQQNPGFR
jgi:hypothetical protein